MHSAWVVRVAGRTCGDGSPSGPQPVYAAGDASEAAIPGAWVASVAGVLATPWKDFLWSGPPRVH